MRTLKLIPFFLALSALAHCTGGFSDPGLGDGIERFSVYYSEPGKDRDTMIDKLVDEELVKLIDSAQQYMYLAVYNFNKTSIVDAVLRAYQRNVDVRVVGDIDEFYTAGYQTMYYNNINMTLGNATGIQHNKFAVVDDEFVFMGTGNLSQTDMVHNNNNWYIIGNKALVKIYKDEFLQMHNGLFAAQKRQRHKSSSLVVNGYPFEIYFSPYQGDQAMDRIIELVNSAQTSIHYMIFAHTHDELDAAVVKMARQKGIPVYGIHDSTFISGVSEEAPKLYSAGFNNDGSMNPTGPFVRWDGNENTSVKNNPAHGGKMHCKTMLIDAGTDHAKMATGSFNWSNNAINNNDENMVVITQPRVVNTVYEQWKGAWGIANDMALKVQNHGHIAATRDIVITEVGWAGASNGSSIANNDDFVEILNNTANPIDLSHWAVQWGTNDKRNLYPVPDNYNWYYENRGSCAGFPAYLTPKPNIICPGQIRLFYNLKPSAFAETGADEQIIYDENGGEIRNSTGGSLSTEHFKFSGTKNFKISDSAFKIRLYDKAMNLIDEAGDGGRAPEGLSEDYLSPKQVYSMERRGCVGGVTPNCNNATSGNKPAAWFTHKVGEAYACSSRADGYSAAACTDYQANTFASAGYIYTAEADPKIKMVEAMSSSTLLVTFDSNMSAGGTNCLALGALTIAETQDIGNLCTAPTISTLTATSDPSQVLVTLSAGVMTSSTCRYSITPTGTCKDAGNRVAAATAVHANAPAARATAILNEVCVNGCASGAPFQSQDWVEIKVTQAGSLKGLKIFYYDDTMFTQLYEFSSIYANTGAIIGLGFKQVPDLFADNNPTLSYPMQIQLRNTTQFSATDGAFILTYCATGENDTVDTSRPECALPNKGIQDALYYSNRDGSLTNGAVKGPLLHFFENLQSFWPITERPIYGLNDRVIQLAGACIGVDSDSNENSTYFCSASSAGVSRAAADMGLSLGTGKAAWRAFPKGGLTPAAANTGW